MDSTSGLLCKEPSNVVVLAAVFVPLLYWLGYVALNPRSSLGFEVNNEHPNLLLVVATTFSGSSN